MAAVTGKTGKVKYTAAAATTAGGGTMTSISATTDRTGFRVATVGHRHWDRTVAPVVYVNSTAHGSTEYAVNYVQGKVEFDAAFALTTAESAQVTADYSYHAFSYLPWTRAWAMDVDVAMHDITVFSTDANAVQWRTFKEGLKGATVDMDRIVDTDSTSTPVWFDRLNTGQDVVLELANIVSGTTYKWEAYAKVSSDGYDAPVDGVEAESVQFQVDGPMYYASTE